MLEKNRRSMWRLEVEAILVTWLAQMCGARPGRCTHLPAAPTAQALQAMQGCPGMACIFSERVANNRLQKVITSLESREGAAVKGKAGSGSQGKVGGRREGWLPGAQPRPVSAPEQAQDEVRAAEQSDKLVPRVKSVGLN